MAEIPPTGQIFTELSSVTRRHNASVLEMYATLYRESPALKELLALGERAKGDRFMNAIREIARG